MHRSVAVFLLALSCVCAAPIMFIRFEDSESKGKLLECSTPFNGLSYRCRFTSKSPEALGLKRHELPVFEIVEDFEDDLTALEVEEISIPVGPPSFAELFQTSKVVVKGNNVNTKYDVFPVEGRTSAGKTRRDCARDEVFNGELSLCMPYIPANKPRTSTILVDDKLVKINAEHKVINVGKIEGPKCKEGEFYMSELDVCVPLESNTKKSSDDDDEED